VQYWGQSSKVPGGNGGGLGLAGGGFGGEGGGSGMGKQSEQSCLQRLYAHTSRSGNKSFQQLSGHMSSPSSSAATRTTAATMSRIIMQKG